MGPRSGRPPLLAGLPPEVFRPGTVVLVEFDPHSLWYEASISVAARALIAGIKTDYHTFQHVPDDIARDLRRQGIDTEVLTGKDRFRLLDSYSVQTGVASPSHHPPYDFASRSLRMAEWKKGALGVLNEGKERQLVHIDENDSPLTRYNSEKDTLDFFQTLTFEAARKREFTFVYAILRGIHSKGFYRQFEYLADAILDFRSREVEGRMEQLVRVRSLRGATCDSRWRLLSVTPKGEVRALGLARGREVLPKAPPRGEASAGMDKALTAADLTFRNRKSAKVFDALMDAFVQDRDVARMMEDRAGWRSLVQLCAATGFSPSSLYPRKGTVNPVMGELASRGLIETRVDPGARGRGGVAMRVRIAYDQVPTRLRIRRRGRS